MSSEQEQLQLAIAALEGGRRALGDAITEMALVPLRAKLAALHADRPPMPTQALRQVTILFLDVVGSTALSQHLDPEEIHAVMDTALARCSDIVASHGGKVLQYAGDSLLAVFGADEVREDDAERALRAGLELLDEGRRQAESVSRRHGRGGFGFRVGAHTGNVLLGGGVDAEGSIRGIAVNIAARMEQTTPPGTLRISRDTYRHVRGLFDVQAQAPLSVKGIDEPVVSYLVIRAKPRAFRVGGRGVEGLETRLIGREVELGHLSDALAAVRRQQRLVAVAIVGEAGVGKTRFLLEFERGAEFQRDGATVFRGRATPQTLVQPYGLLRDIVAGWLRIGDADTLAEAQIKIEQGIGPLFANDGPDRALAHAHLLGQLIGVDFADSVHIHGIRADGKQIRDRGFHTAAQVLRRVALADQAPILLLLEDLHWADEGSLDFIALLRDVDCDVPMLMIGLTRPALFERRADWGGEGWRRIELAPLDEHASALLSRELLRKLPDVPAAVQSLLISNAAGNPFHMEELVNMLLDQGAIEVGDEHWTLRADMMLTTPVPQTLTAVLQARLDSLMPTEKLTLQQASAIGFVFWDQALAAIDTRAVDAMASITQRAMAVSHQRASFDGVREFAFSHQALHQVTYETVLKRLRRQYHAKAGAWLAGLGGARANDFLVQAAEQFERAGDAVQACEYFARAATYAAARYAHQSVLGAAARALTLIGTDDSTGTRAMRWRLLEVRERTFDLQGRRAEQAADIDALRELADALDDDALRAEVAWRRSDFALRTADFRAMESAARDAMALAERAGAVAVGLRAQQRLAVALSVLGDTAAGRAIANENLAAARALGLRSAEALALSAIASIANEQEDWMSCLEALECKLEVEMELGNQRSACTTLINMGASLLELGQRSRARRHLEDGLQLARAVGDRATECYPLLRLAVLATHDGDSLAALAHAQAALGIAVAIQDALLEANSLCRVGDATLQMGNLEAAAAAFERAHMIAVSLKHVRRHDAAAGLARVALARGESPQRLEPVSALIAHLFAGGHLQGTDSRVILLTIHRVLARDKDPRARQMLENANAELQARSAAIADPGLRASFLTNIPEHREIVAAFHAAA